MGRNNEDVNNSVDRIFPKTAGSGFKVDPDDPTFPWVDLTGLVQPNAYSPGTSPSYEEFQPGINGLSYDVNDILDCVFHLPHEWVPNADAEIHIHWGNNVQMEVGDTFSILPTATYGSRDGIYTTTPIVLAPITYTVTGSALPIYSHRVTEVPLCRVNGTANTFDRSIIEVDGLFKVAFVVTAESLSNSGKLFLGTADIHHQSTGIGTKNNASPFYD